jgi:hypothetical protein
MTWFRSRIRPVTRLALFALAFQMAISFGHMDADELGLPSLGLVSPTHVVRTHVVLTHVGPTHVVLTHVGPTHVGPTHVVRTHVVPNAIDAAIAPAGRDRVPAAPDGYCPICASMALVATAFPSLPPVLVVPPQGRPEWPGPIPAEGISPKLALSFQARAPPTLA